MLLKDVRSRLLPLKQREVFPLHYHDYSDSMIIDEWSAFRMDFLPTHDDSTYS